MVWKKVSNSDVGTADLFGGDDVDKISDLFSGVDVDDVTLNVDLEVQKGVVFQEQAAPASPAATKYAVYVDSGDGKLKKKNSAGAIVNLEDTAPSGSAGGDLTGTYPNPTVANDAITYAKIQNVSATDRLLGRDTAGAGDIEELTASGGIEFTGTGIQTSAFTGDVTKSAGGTATTIANDAVTTAKILNDNVTFAKMQNIATDRLVGRDTAATGDPEELTVGGGIEFTGTGGIQTSAFTGDVTKTAGGTATTIANNAVTDAKINTHTTTKITTTNKSLLNSSIAYIDQANYFGDFEQAFKDDKFKIRNPADTFNYVFTGSAIAADRILTLPLLTADDTMAVLNFAQTLKNKTVNSGFSYGGNPDGNIIRGTGADNPYAGSATGATLRRTGLFHALTSTGGEGLWSTSLTAIGSNTGQRHATEGRYQDYATGAVSGNNAGLRQTILLYRRDWSIYHMLRIAVSSTANIRIFIGWSSDSAEVAGEDPLNALSGAGLGKRSADTNWQIIRNDGAGATVFVDTGVALTTSFTTLEMQLDGTNFQTRIDGVEQTAQTTELPAASTGMFAHCQIETSAVADKTISICPIYSRVGT